ncbi:MAG: ferritin-like domain-containing protein [Candidatus Acidiferrum sp.]
MTMRINIPQAGILDPTELKRQLIITGENRASARRNFLKNVGLASAGIAAGAIIQGCSGGSKANAQTVPEADVLNFALNLEYLEGEFYSKTVNGVYLDSSVTGGTSTATGGAKVTFTDAATAAIAAEIASDEALHIKYLRTALGGMAVAEPVINLDALGVINTQALFLLASRALEDTGVSAYAGAATLLTGNNLQAAAQILATEAYHAGNVRLQVVQQNVPGLTKLDSQDVLPDSTHYFTVDANALAIKRTTSQVLAIVYGSATAGTSKGGFFPNGLNGNIKTV